MSKSQILEGRFPRYTLKMRGKEAIRIRYEGQDLGVFDLESLWEEFRKTIPEVGGVNDPDKRYVIERAIETLQGKSPKDWKRRPGAKVAGGWVDRWDGRRKPGSYPIAHSVPRRRKSKPLFLRLWKWIRGLGIFGSLQRVKARR